MPLSHSPPNKYANCAKTLPIQVAAISQTPINTRSPMFAFEPQADHRCIIWGWMAGRLKTPYLLGIRDVAGKRWVNRKMWKKAEKVPNVLPKVYPR